MNFVVAVVILVSKYKLLYRAHCVRDGEFSLLKIFFFHSHTCPILSLNSSWSKNVCLLQVAYCLTGVTLEPGSEHWGRGFFHLLIKPLVFSEHRVSSSQGSVCVLFHFLPAQHRIRNFPHQGPHPGPCSGSTVLTTGPAEKPPMRSQWPFPSPGIILVPIQAPTLPLRLRVIFSPTPNPSPQRDSNCSSRQP